MAEPILLGKSDKDVVLLPHMANRHGLVAGATGTGKTVSMRVMAEEFSKLGVPVFMADVKGDVAGIANAGGTHPKVKERVQVLNLTDYQAQGFPVVLWDVFGEQGHPLRTTISEMGPLLLSRLLKLNDTQSGIMSMAFRIADDNGLLLLDLKDLRSMLAYLSENAKQFKAEYGNISSSSVGAIQRALLALEEEGADELFGEPAINLNDFMMTDRDGRGVINILAADKLMRSPKVYATFLLWLLAELFETLPEAGDPEVPNLVFFFDEAHLLFDEAPRILIDKIEQVVRLIRSKGVGVYFVTQNPIDLPDSVLGQLGNRVQHALRAFTPRDQKAVRAAAETFRTNPDVDVAKEITELGVGEALVSTLNDKGHPNMVERTMICPPESSMDVLLPRERDDVLRQSRFYGRYEKEVDRESAYEVLKERREELEKQKEKERSEQEKEARERRDKRSRSRKDSLLESFAKSTARSIGSSIGRKIIRGILGNLF